MADDFNYWNKDKSRALAAEIDFITMHAHPLWNGQQLPDALPWLQRFHRATVVVNYGATVMVKNNQKVKVGDPIFEWDPFADFVLSEKTGVVQYVDIIPGVSLSETVDEKTRRKQPMIMEPTEKNVHPSIQVLSAKTGRALAEYIIPTGAMLLVEDGEEVVPGTHLVKIPREVAQSGDITGGLPRVAELFEARRPRDTATVTEIDGSVAFRGTTRGLRKLVVVGDTGVEGLVLDLHEMRGVESGPGRLRVAAADVTGVIPLMIVSDYLTDIATVCLEATLKLAWRDMIRRHGAPAGTDHGNMGIGIIGYGKLGGIELGYGSDLDLVFIHNAAPNSMTDGQRSVAADVFYARLAQRMIHILTTRTASGQLYEVDMRLRPNGKSGMLVTPINAFRSYQEKDAWTWEHQALVRARGIGGDRSVIDAFEAIRNAIVQRERDGAKLLAEVVEMREKMRDNLDKSSDDTFDVKQGRGGITDIEFMVQYLLLRFSSEHPQLCHYSDNIRQLEALENACLLDVHVAERLAGIYRVLRAAHHRYALQEKPAIIPSDELAEERRIVSEAWEKLMQPDASASRSA